MSPRRPDPACIGPLRRVLGVVAALLAAGCGAPAPRATPEQPRSVLLITIDTLRADALGAYGKSDAGTPWIDRLAATGVRFDDARAHNVVTLPSHANILSGRLPLEHGVRDNSGFRLPRDVATLATILRDRGYVTAAFVSAFPLDSRFGLDRGFDVYEDSFADAGPHPGLLEPERPAPNTVALARRWLDNHADVPSFCWVHLFEPHFPYLPPPDLAARFAGDPYQGEVAAADRALAPLLKPLLDAPPAGLPLVVLTADHGESLGEHGEASHGVFGYEATLRVPLVLWAPGLVEPAVSSRQAGHVDILPTVLDAVGLPQPEGLRGESLLAAPSQPARTHYFEALSGRLNRGWAPLHGVVHDGTKYVSLPIPELYDLRIDPGEFDNLAPAQPERVAELAQILAELRADDAGIEPSIESRETRERLASLGYVSPDPGASVADVFTEADDPKRLVAIDQSLQQVTDLFLDGDLAAAAKHGRDLVRRHPDMLLARLQLAVVERQLGDLDAAIGTLFGALVLSPDRAEVLALLGSCLTQAGRAAEAAELLEAHTLEAEPDPEVSTTRALALARLGRVDESLALLERARGIDPESAAIQVHLGTIHLLAGQRELARAAFEQAVARNWRVSRAHSSLGAMAAEDGRPEEAIEHWRLAVELEPAEYDRILALGLGLWRAGRRDAARPCLEFFVLSAPRERYAAAIDGVRAMLADQ